MNKHFRVHMDKPFGCKRCHKSFRDEESFNQHELVHKREDVEKRLQGLPLPSSEPDPAEDNNIITLFPRNVPNKAAVKNIINIAPSQQRSMAATSVVSISKPETEQATTHKPAEASLTL